MSIQQFPVLKENQFALLRNDLYTGVVKDVNIIDATKLNQEVYTVYESFQDAVERAEKIVIEYDFIECFIFDATKKIIKHIQPN